MIWGCYGSLRAQINVRFDSYSKYELPERSEKNTLLFSSAKGRIMISPVPQPSDIDNLVISDIAIDDKVLKKLRGLDVVNLELYNVRGNVDSLLSVFLIMPRARAIKIYDTHIGDVFAQQKRWNSIKRLEILYCEVSAISNILKQMPGIRYLSITDSKIESLSFDTVFESLVFLDLANCGQSSFPRGMDNCPNLECFRFYGNRFQQTDIKVLCKNKELREVHLDNCGITRFPIELTELTNLQMLVLEENLIENIPPQISQFKGLKYLGLSSSTCQLNKNTLDSLRGVLPICCFPDVSVVINKYHDSRIMPPPSSYLTLFGRIYNIFFKNRCKNHSAKSDKCIGEENK